jgi:hypothetical protein
MEDSFAAGRSFIWRQARLLERRLFATVFEHAPATGVIDALRGYQNQDGGFGHGLEPDKRCPASLPIDVEVALQAMVTAGEVDVAMAQRACDFLGQVAAKAAAAGAVPLAMPVIEAFPRAEHLTEWTYEPGLNPTAGLVGLLCQLGVEHPWVAVGSQYCWTQLEAGYLPDGAHGMSEVLIFLEHTPERDRADRLSDAVTNHLPTVELFHADPDAEGYGLSPLHFAPSPDSRWRFLFSDSQIEGHLDRLARDQQPDGGWPITWEPPSEASALEWRGHQTLQALRTLVAYGRLTAPD